MKTGVISGMKSHSGNTNKNLSINIKIILKYLIFPTRNEWRMRIQMGQKCPQIYFDNSVMN